MGLPAFAGGPPCEKALQPQGVVLRKFVTQDDVKANIELLRRECAASRPGGLFDESCERGGVFGPGSLMWELSRIPLLGLYAETELALQLAHPAGAQGVHDHSDKLKNDPLARFQSTFNYIWRMTYGSFSEAEKLALTLNKIHSHVTGVMPVTAGGYLEGEAYSANDPEALLWVHATHWWAVLKTYEAFVRPLTVAERSAYIRDTRKYALLLGIPDEMIPSSWATFNIYMREMIKDKLVYTPDALKIHYRTQKLIRNLKLVGNVAMLLKNQYSKLITSNELDPSLARQFGIKRTLSHKIAYRALLPLLRASYAHLPTLVRRLHLDFITGVPVKQMLELPLYRMAMARSRGIEPSPEDQIAYEYLIGKRGGIPTFLTGKKPAPKQKP